MAEIIRRGPKFPSFKTGQVYGGSEVTYTLFSFEQLLATFLATFVATSVATFIATFVAAF